MLFVGGGFFRREVRERRIHAAKGSCTVALGHIQGAVEEVAEAVGEIGVVALNQPFVAEVGIASGGDVAQEVVSESCTTILLRESGGVHDIAEALAHLRAGDIPPSMNEEGGDLFVGESQRMEHDRPVDAVWGNEDVFSDHVNGWPLGLEIR